jgi:hypothetical protein
MAARPNLAVQARSECELMDLAVNPNPAVGIPNITLPDLICLA